MRSSKSFGILRWSGCCGGGGLGVGAMDQEKEERWREICVAFEPKKALRQITSGLRHLHGLK